MSSAHSIAAWKSHALPGASADNTSALLEAASRIGGRLVRTALWEDAACTWIISVNDPSAPYARRLLSEPAAGDLYQGASGIALFLTELLRVTGDHELQRTIEGALAHSAKLARSLPRNAFGFHSGRTGIAYALARYAHVSQRSEFLEAASDIIAPLAGSEPNDVSLDVIGGAAGAIPVLLRLASWLDMPDSRASALALGEHIINKARRGPSGWSWPGAGTHVRDLTGLAHGAAGFAHALVELYRETSDPRFRFGATEAFRYERSLYVPEERNWPDNRNQTLSKVLSSVESREALIQHLRRGGSPPPYVRHCMTAWCHGAAGIGLTRLHAYQVLREDVLLEEAIVAVRTTTATATTVDVNFSLCHGLFGNEETLLLASSVLDDRSLFEGVHARAEEAVADFEFRGRPWPTGVVRAGPDPSLLVGDAGIGYHLLRVHDATTESILLPLGRPGPVDAVHPSMPATGVAKPHQTDELLEMRARFIDEYFGRSIRVAERLAVGSQIHRAIATRAEQGDVSDVTAAAELLQQLIDSDADRERAAVLDDAFCYERCRFDAVLGMTDFTRATTDAMARLPEDRVDWAKARFSVAGAASLVEQGFDWDSFLMESGDSYPRRLDVPIQTVVHASGGQLETYRPSPLASIVMRALTTPRTIAEVTRDVQAAVDADEVERQLIEHATVEQIKNACRVGIVVVVTERVERGE